ncbi:zinc finger MYND domain-containing protein [Candidatus Bathyarchaeota archaeon]|nr:zinc finger MYND domain-containing protein [Candidatus Bathyarchaeota archaeon]
MSSPMCEVCGRKNQVRRCTSCRAVYYCGKECQIVDRRRHKKGCLAVKHARDVFEREDQAMREPGGPGGPPDQIENAADTRPYISARFLFADALLKNFGTIHPRDEAVGTALNHLLDLLAFNRVDPLYLRHIIPALYVTLGMDQHAYDFVKWWATSYAEDPEIPWNDLNVPYLDTRDADILEPLAEEWKLSEERAFDLSHPMIVMVLKIRALLDLTAVRSARRSLRGILPPEIIDMVQDHLADGIVASRPEMLRWDTGKITSHIDTLRRQITQLFEDIHAENPHLWAAMFRGFEKPKAALGERPIGYSKDAGEEARYVVGYTLAAWIDDPGAVDLMYDVFRDRC